jgi:hypothetical protein
MSAYSKLLPFGTCLLTKKLGYQRFLLHLQQLLQNSCLDLCMRSVIHQLSLLLKAFSYERYGLVLYSNLDRILFSSFICLLWYDSEFLIIGTIRKKLLILDCFFAFLSKQCLLMVGMPVVSHFIFICSALL